MAISLTHTEKLRILADLIAVAGSDGQHRDEEYDFLHRMAERLRVEPVDMEALFTSVEKYPAPQPEKERIQLFGYLLEMATIDGEVSADELVLLRDMGFKLGLRMQAVDQSLKRLRVMGGMPLACEEVEAIFRLHGN